MDADRAIGEVLELDRAVARGLAFARRDQKTLVLVTADHECSGFSVLGARGGGFPRYAIAPDGYPVRWDVDGKLLVGFGATADGSGVHTATDVPISAYAADPEAWRPFVGVHTNTDVFFEIAGVFLGGAP
jgi:alkaline phosphatase